jgi:hypothetical protein
MATERAPYEARWDSDSKPYVGGPSAGSSTGTDYYGGTLSPDSRFSSEADAKAGAIVANIAYQAGIAKAQADMRAALGIKHGS